jgi:excisionase family DNA binding protein
MTAINPKAPTPDQPSGRTGATLDLTVPLPAVLNLMQAAALLGLGRTTAYRLVHDNEWPTPVLWLGGQIKIPTQPLLDLLATGTRRPA